MKVRSPEQLISHKIPDSQLKKLENVAGQYEKYFLQEMVKAMRSSVHRSDLLPQGMAEKIYQEQLDQEYVNSWVDQGGVGLSKIIVQDIVEKILGHSSFRLNSTEQPRMFKIEPEKKGGTILSPMKATILGVHTTEKGNTQIYLGGPNNQRVAIEYQGSAVSLVPGQQVLPNQPLGKNSDLSPLLVKFI